MLNFFMSVSKRAKQLILVVGRLTKCNQYYNLPGICSNTKHMLKQFLCISHWSQEAPPSTTIGTTSTPFCLRKLWSHWRKGIWRGCQHFFKRGDSIQSCMWWHQGKTGKWGIRSCSINNANLFFVAPIYLILY